MKFSKSENKYEELIRMISALDLYSAKQVIKQPSHSKDNFNKGI